MVLIKTGISGSCTKHYKYNSLEPTWLEFILKNIIWFLFTRNHHDYFISGFNCAPLADYWNSKDASWNWMMTKLYSEGKSGNNFELKSRILETWLSTRKYGHNLSFSCGYTSVFTQLLNSLDVHRSFGNPHLKKLQSSPFSYRFATKWHRFSEILFISVNKLLSSVWSLYRVVDKQCFNVEIYQVPWPFQSMPAIIVW